MLNLKQLVFSAAELLPNIFIEKNTVKKKNGLRNEVTNYDYLVQEFIINSIKKEYPSAYFLGEEGVLETNIYAKTLFVIDPIDGTTNFINNCNFSCISIAMLSYGEVIEAAVYNPYLKEIFYAKKDEGAWLNNQRIQVKDVSLKESVVGYSNCPYDEEITDLTFEFGKNLFKKSLDFRRMGSSALEICYSACGRYQLYCEMILYPWDYLAASLIVKEAGGIITNLHGEKISIGKRNSILSGCPTAHGEVIKIYKKFLKDTNFSINTNCNLN